MSRHRGQHVRQHPVHAAVRHDAQEMRGAARALEGPMKPWMAPFASKEPSSMARSICPRSMATTRPAPMLVCPTSELPICPAGQPRFGPVGDQARMGASARSRSTGQAFSAQPVGVGEGIVAVPSRRDAQDDGCFE
jgi:hypothetical protein